MHPASRCGWRSGRSRSPARARCCQGRGLRRLPHRPARRRRRSAASPKLPIIPGHEIVGHVAALRGRASSRFGPASASACPGSGTPAAAAAIAGTGARTCATRRASPATRSTAALPSYAVADAAYCFPIPDGLRRRRGRAAAVRRPDRLALAAHGRRRRERLGIYGFGAAAHIVAQVARFEGRRVYAFTRPGDEAAQALRARAGRASGPAARTSRRPSRSTPRSSSRRSARWCRRRCAPCARAARWSAAAST